MKTRSDQTIERILPVSRGGHAVERNIVEVAFFLGGDLLLEEEGIGGGLNLGGGIGWIEGEEGRGLPSFDLAQLAGEFLPRAEALIL